MNGVQGQCFGHTGTGSITSQLRAQGTRFIVMGRAAILLRPNVRIPPRELR